MTAALCSAALAAVMAACSPDAPAPTPPAPAPSVSGWLLGAPDPMAPTSSNTNIYKVRPDGTGKVYLTTGSDMKFSPAWSWDGARVAFVMAAPGGVQISTMNVDGTGRTVLPPFGISPSFSPDGETLLYVTGSPSEIWRMDAASGRNRKQLTHTSGVASSRHGDRMQGSEWATFSPDGKRVLYTSTQSGHRELWTMAPDGTGQTQLTFPTDPEASDANAAAWSPDGKLVAFFGGYEGEYGNVYIANSDGSGRRKLTRCVDFGTAGRSANCDRPHWSPDGLQIIYQSSIALEGGGKIDPNIAIRTWVINLDGTGNRVLFDPALNPGTKAWAP